MPSAGQLGDRRGRASALGRSRKTRKPARCRSRSSAAVGSVELRARRGWRRRRRGCRRRTGGRATACGVGGDVGAAAEDRLGAPLVTSSRRAVGGRRTRTEASWRSWSKGRMPEPLVAGDRRRLGAPRRAPPTAPTSSGLPPTAPPRGQRRLVAQQARARSGSVDWRRRPGRALARSVIAPSVSVPVLSVNSTSMLPRSSMHTSRLTSTLRAASCARAGRQADADDRRAAAAA